MPCHQELSSYFNQDSLASGATIEAQIPPSRSLDLQTYTLSFLAWLGATHSFIRAKKKRAQAAPSIWKYFDIDRAHTYLSKTGLQTICRTLLFVSLWLSSPQWLPSCLLCLPALEWMANGFCRAWPAMILAVYR